MSLTARYLATHPATPEKWLLQWLGGPTSLTGLQVNSATAQRLTAVTCGLRIISETPAVLPLILYRRRAAGGKDRARSHHLYWLLHNQPNPWQTAFEFKRMLSWHAASRGAAYAEILLKGNGEIAALVPLNSDRVLPYIEEDDTIVFRYTPRRGPQREIPFSRMFKLLAFSEDGICGRSMFEVCQESVGVGLAAEDFAARFYANNAMPGGIIKYPGTLKKETAAKLRQEWASRQGGVSGFASTAILDQAMEYQQLGMKLDDAQFIESRKFQVTEIARIMRLPPHMLMDLERATFTNIEHQGLDFVVHSMAPWFVMWEQAIWRDLLLEEEQQDYYAEYLVDALLRGDLPSRYAAYAIGRQWGWLNADDVCDRENLNPLPDGQGKTYLVPANMIPADAVGQATPAPDQAPALPAPPGARLLGAGLPRDPLIGLLEDPLRRLARREEQLVAKKSGPALVKALEGHGVIVAQTLLAVVTNIGHLRASSVPVDLLEDFTAGYAAGYSRRTLEFWKTADGKDTRDPKAEAAALLTALDTVLAGALAHPLLEAVA